MVGSQRAALFNATSTWIDPRVWSGLVRAYALFLALATVAEYNKLWALVFADRLMTAEDRVFGVFGVDATSVGLFVIPWLAGQVVIVLWLALLVRPRTPDASEPAVALTIEMMARAGLKLSGFRAPRLLIGAVAQPVVLSIAAKPFLILPRQGLAYFKHRLGAQATAAFRSVIGHEIAHLTTWDDLLFFPWFSYFVGAVLCCAAGLFQAWHGILSYSLVLSHVVVTGSLGLLGFYVLRRRESYCDAYSVMLLGNESPTRLALASLASESTGGRLWQGTHFDARTRLALLAQRGRPFLELSRIDFGIAAFIYFNSNSGVISSLSKGPTVFHETLSLLDFVIQQLLLLLLLLMVAGLAVVREGKRFRFRELAVPAAVCLITGRVHDFLREGSYDLIAVFVGIVMVVTFTAIGTPFFVIAVRAIYDWCLAILYQPFPDAAGRLLVNLVRFVAIFAVIDKLTDIAMSLWASQAFADPRTLMQSQLDESLVAKMKPLVPLFVVGSSMVLVKAALVLGLASWARRKWTKPVRVQCPRCLAPVDSQAMKKPLIQHCPFCGGVLRGDLLIQLAAETGE